MAKATKYLCLATVLIGISTQAMAQSGDAEATQQGPLYSQAGFYLGCVVASEDENSQHTFELDDTIGEANCVALARD